MKTGAFARVSLGLRARNGVYVRIHDDDVSRNPVDRACIIARSYGGFTLDQGIRRSGRRAGLTPAMSVQDCFGSV